MKHVLQKTLNKTANLFRDRGNITQGNGCRRLFPLGNSVARSSLYSNKKQQGVIRVSSEVSDFLKCLRVFFSHLAQLERGERSVGEEGVRVRRSLLKRRIGQENTGYNNIT